MKQDKGHVVVIMDKLKYHKLCLMILGNGNFKRLDNDPTKKNKNNTLNLTLTISLPDEEAPQRSVKIKI